MNEVLEMLRTTIEILRFGDLGYGDYCSRSSRRRGLTRLLKLLDCVVLCLDSGALLLDKCLELIERLFELLELSHRRGWWRRWTNGSLATSRTGEGFLTKRGKRRGRSETTTGGTEGDRWTRGRTSGRTRRRRGWCRNVCKEKENKNLLTRSDREFYFS